MELKEVLTEIKSRVKPYHHINMSASTYFNTIRNIEAGLCKQTTIDIFLEKFGYEKIEVIDNWIKK